MQYAYADDSDVTNYDDVTTIVGGVNSSNATVDHEGLSQASQWVLIVLYTTTTLLAVVGNILVIVVFTVGTRSRTDLRMFLINLAAADLVMALFCMPFTFTTTMLHDWIFTGPACTLVLYMQLVAVTASVGTSTAIAVDRYLVVAYPMRSRNPRKRSRIAIGAVWTTAAALSSVQLVVARVQIVELAPGVEMTHCREDWPDANWVVGYTFFILATTYVVPLAIIAPAYGFVGWKLWRRKAPGNADEVRDTQQLKSKRKVIKMLVTVVSLFAVCWLPLHLFILIMDFNPHLSDESRPEASTVVAAIYTTVHWLAMSNSFVNPIIYGFLNDSFRSDLHQLLNVCFWWCPVRCQCCSSQTTYVTESHSQLTNNRRWSLQELPETARLCQNPPPGNTSSTAKILPYRNTVTRLVPASERSIPPLANDHQTVLK